MIFLKWVAEWENCGKEYGYKDLKQLKLDNYLLPKWEKWSQTLSPDVNTTVGLKQEIPVRTHLSESVKYLSLKKLRFNMNEIYSRAVETSESGKFTWLLFRENMQTLFWNWILVFTSLKLPYDIFLPYESKDEMKDFRFANRHISMNIIKKEDAGDQQIRVRVNRRKLKTTRNLQTFPMRKIM